MLQTEYKFYLGFENIFCHEYVTEKVFNILKLWVVPIVMGAANYQDVTPPHSVINVKDFESPKMLASYLMELINDDEKYEEYFQWKTDHHVLGMNEAFRSGFCDLCERLNEPDQKQKGSYEHLDEWWGKDTLCDRNTKWNF